MASVIGRHGDADVNDNRRLLLQLCCNNALCIMNTFLQHRNVHKYTCCRDSLDQRSQASAEIFPGGKRRHFAYPFQVADDAVRMDVHKTLYPSYITKKMPCVTATVTTVTKMHFIGAEMLLFHRCMLSHIIKLRFYRYHQSLSRCIICGARFRILNMWRFQGGKTSTAVT